MPFRTLVYRFGFAALAIAFSEAAIAGFVAGDVYVVSMSLPGPSGTSVPGVFRYLPSSGSSGVLVTLPAGSFGSGPLVQPGGATYDPFRDRLLIPLAEPSLTLGTVDSAGSLSTIPISGATPKLLAAGPSGIVYLIASHQVFYLDATNSVHELRDSGGGSTDLSTVAGPVLSSALYDVGTQSVIVATVNGLLTRFVRIPVDATGTVRSGPLAATTTDLAPSLDEVVAGMSGGPNGSIFVTLDINANGTLPQLQTIEPTTFASTVFASTSGFSNAALTTGAWIATNGHGIALDTLADVLREYVPGGNGPGTVVATGVSSAGGSAEAARLVVIGTTINGNPHVTGDLNNDGHVSAADLAILLGAWGPCPNCAACPADLNGDCVVDAADLGILLGNWS